MNLRKQQEKITELYRRGDIDGAREGFENLVAYLEDADDTIHIAYAEALLGLGSLFEKNIKDLQAAERCWKKIVDLTPGIDGVLELDEDEFDIHTQALLLLALAQKKSGKIPEARANLENLRAIAVETRGENSSDVKTIDAHIAEL